MSEPREQYYEIFKKKPVKEIASVIKIFAGYNTSKEDKYKRTIVFYDTPDDLLRSTKIILSTDTRDKKKRELILERDIENNPHKKFIKMFEKYRFVKDVDVNSEPRNNLEFLSYSLSRCFTEPLTFDPDSLFKTVIPKLYVEFKNQDFKMINAKGFKARLTVEQVIFKNVETKRENYVNFLRIVEEEGSEHGDVYFEELNRRLAKQCKFLFAIEESKYAQALRMTKKIEKNDDEQN